MKTFIAIMALALLLVGCASVSTPTQIQIATGVGQGVGLGLNIADQQAAVAPYAAEINAGVVTLCSIEGLASPQAAEVALEKGAAQITTALSKMGASAGTLIALIQAGVTSIEATAESAEASQALADLQAFSKGLCSTFVPIVVSAPAPTPVVKAKMSIMDRIKWDAKKVFIKSWHKR